MIVCILSSENRVSVGLQARSPRFHSTYCEETVPGLMMGSRRVTSRIGWVRMKKASTEAVYAARAVKMAAILILCGLGKDVG
jgi:hypothetical protein